MNSSLLEAGDQYFRRECPTRYSLVVVRNGRLVFERYYRGTGSQSALHVMSISKSVLSILLGQAFNEGYLDSIDRKLLDYYPEYATPSLDPRKREITLRHLLTMTAGLQWVETDTGPSRGDGLWRHRGGGSPKSEVDSPSGIG